MQTSSCCLNGLLAGLVVIAGLGVMPAHGSVLPFAPDVSGTWVGSLAVQGTSLRVVFHISKGEDGAYTATMDSPDQGATGIPVSAVKVTGDTLRIEVSAIGGVYEGTVGEDGKKASGEWRQSGMTLPLDLEKTDEPTGLNRPQEPEGPFPYLEEDVSFENRDDGVRLAGTLTRPSDGGPFPAVVLISGSGPQDRDETVFGHRPFLVLADYLTRRGVAVLRFDDRGVAESTGAFATATSADFAKDVRAAVAFLQGREDIDSREIGLIGHSEGGIVAPMVAAGSDDIAFVVLLAGTGLPGNEILLLQAALINRANGVSEELIARNRKQQEALFAVLSKEPDDGVAAEQARGVLREALASMPAEDKRALGISGTDEGVIVERQVQQLVSPWMRFFVSYDPRPALRRVTCPVLAINGEKDLQVPPKENLAAIAEALEEGGNTHATVRELPGLNHLFQTAGSGAPSEYGRIEETFSETALSAIGDWVTSQTIRLQDTMP